MLTLIPQKSQKGLRRLLVSSTRLARLLAVGALLLGSLGSQAQVSGAQAIPSATYPTLAAAFTALNTQGYPGRGRGRCHLQHRAGLHRNSGQPRA